MEKAYQTLERIDRRIQEAVRGNDIKLYGTLTKMRREHIEENGLIPKESIA